MSWVDLIMIEVSILVLTNIVLKGFIATKDDPIVNIIQKDEMEEMVEMTYYIRKMIKFNRIMVFVAQIVTIITMMFYKN